MRTRDRPQTDPEGEPPQRAEAPSGPLPDDAPIELDIYVRPAKSPTSDDLGPLAHAPPLERTYLENEEFAARFSAAPGDLAIAAHGASDLNLSVDPAAMEALERRVVVSGTAATVGDAFGVRLMRYEEFGGEYYGYEGEVKLPDALVPVVTAIAGLDNRPLFSSSTVGGASPAFPTLNLDDVAAIYDFPTRKPDGSPLTGKGVTVGILRLGGHFEQADIKSYFDELGRPVPAITQVGTSHSEDVMALVETSVDIEVIGRLAPGAKIVVYFADGTDKKAYLRLLHAAVNDTTNSPAVLSISWGVPEQLWDVGQPAEIDLTLQLAHTKGITVCVATGDSGSSGIAPRQGGPDGKAHVALPASSPWALACGGTVLDRNAAGNVTEVVWNDQYGATGGGVSAVFPAQVWQQQMHVPQRANPGGGTGRGLPDVAAHAGVTHYLTDAPGWRSPHIGGTSVSAPIWAALVARINEAAGKNMGYLNAYMCAQYAAGPGRVAFRDITSGDNKQRLKKGTAWVTPPSYAAGAQWDACTGLGSPSGKRLLDLLLKAPKS